MKGSVGTGTSVSAGARGAVSGGAGSLKGAGMSLSPETRSASAVSAFSSRGLSKFNASPISFKDVGPKAPPSIININRGRTQAKMFDMARPVRTEAVVPFKNLTNPNSINIKNATEKKASFARVKALEPANIFDFSRKPAKDAPVFLGQNKARAAKQETPVKPLQVLRTVRPDTPVLKAKLKPEANISRPETLNRVASVPQSAGLRENRATQKDEQIKPVMQVELSQMIKVKPDAGPRVRRAVELDMAQAAATVSVLKQARNMTEPEAQREIAKVLLQKYEGKAGVEVLPQLTLESQVGPAAVKTGEQIGKNKNPGPVKSFYFDEDERAQKEREESAVREAEFLLAYRKPEEDPVTGKDVAQRLGNPGEKAMSEVSLQYGRDGSYELFREEVSKTGAVENAFTMGSVVKKAVKLFKAVKLSTAAGGATREHAQIVYGSVLHKKPANIGKDGYGKFHEDSSLRLWYIPQNQGTPSEVA